MAASLTMLCPRAIGPLSFHCIQFPAIVPGMASRRRCAVAARTLVTASPSPSISVHKGFKIQAAFCVERPPLRVLEPDHKTRWKVFREAWEQRTGNHLTLDDEIVFMRFHFHFLEGGNVGKRGSALELDGTPGGGRLEAGSSDALATQSRSGAGLEALLSQEGLGDLAFPEQGKRKSRRRRVDKRVLAKVDDSDVRSLQRLATCSIFLLVRYEGAGRWTFPKADRAHGEPMKETLLKLCGRQLGTKFEPYIVGACPFSCRKKKNDHLPGIEGRKVFYYRGRLVPGMDLAPPESSPVTDWAWCSRAELPKYLAEGEWHAVRESLPLDNL